MSLPQRKPTRLRDYDYSNSGYYFITICTHNHKNLFGNIELQELCDIPQIKLSKIGEIVECELLKIESHYSNIEIDKFVIMPNHIHLIIKITERINPFPTIKFDISNIIGKYKAAVTRNVGNAFMHSEKHKIWQRSFHDHIIRGDEDYLKIWNYIDGNPQKWEKDCFYNE